jgi:hypothetical protein
MADKPKPFKMLGTEKMETQRNKDGSMSVRSSESMALEFDTIKSIGLENVLDVEVHTINRLFNSVSHYIRFHDGGEIRFSYNEKGQLMEFSATHIGAEILNGERLLLKRAVK